MQFNNHYNLKGLHADFSPSQPHWLNYDTEKAKLVYLTRKAAEHGTKLHDWAQQTIKLGIRQARTNKTLNMYVNDAISYRMEPEVVLFYSPKIFGTADAISFNGKILRIHDLKTGNKKADIRQLKCYAALFCLEYRFNPEDIKIELRIYQHDKIYEDFPEAQEIRAYMDHIIYMDEVLTEADKEV